jgi:hypothetical protein
MCGCGGGRNTQRSRRIPPRVPTVAVAAPQTLTPFVSRSAANDALTVTQSTAVGSAARREMDRRRRETIMARLGRM